MYPRQSHPASFHPRPGHGQRRLCSQGPRSPRAAGWSGFSSPPEANTPTQCGFSQWGRSESNPEFSRSTSSEPGSERGQVLTWGRRPASLLEVLGGPLRVQSRLPWHLLQRVPGPPPWLLSTPARLGWGRQAEGSPRVSSCSPTFPRE